MTTKKPLRELFEDKARAGDGAYAIAWALLDLSDSQEATAKALQRLGNGDASTHYGAIEGLAMKIEQAAEIIGSQIGGVADSIRLSSEE